MGILGKKKKEEEKVVDIGGEVEKTEIPAPEDKKPAVPEPVKEIDLTDDEAKELKEFDEKLTGQRVRHSFIRDDFLLKEQQMLQSIRALTANFNQELKRIYKRNKVQNVRLKDIRYEEKKLLLL